MGRFKVGDAVEFSYSDGNGARTGVIGHTNSDGSVMEYDVPDEDGTRRRWCYRDTGLRLIAPAPPVTRPIQPGDYIKDPGPRPVDAEPLRVGDVVYITAPCLLVQSLSDVSRSPAIGDIVRYAQGGWDPIGNVRRLPPDAVLDEARSPRRDGVTSVVAGPVVTPSPDVSFTPVTLETATGLDLDWLARDLTGATRDNGEADEAFRSRCLKYRASLVKRMTPEGDEHRALLSRALILISGLNLQHHALTREQFEVAQGLCRDLVKVLKPGRG